MRVRKGLAAATTVATLLAGACSPDVEAPASPGSSSQPSTPAPPSARPQGPPAPTEAYCVALNEFPQPEAITDPERRKEIARALGVTVQGLEDARYWIVSCPSLRYPEDPDPVTTVYEGNDPRICYVSRVISNEPTVRDQLYQFFGVLCVDRASESASPALNPLAVWQPHP